MRCKRSKHNSWRRSFYPSDSSFGTISAQTFLMFISSLRIRRRFSPSKLTSSATARTPKLRSFRITSRTISMLSSVTAVRGRPGRSYFSSFLCLPKIGCAIQTREHETCNLHRKPVNNWKVSVADFFSLTSNLMLTRSLLQSDIFRPRIRTRLYLKMRPLVLSKAIELNLVTLWQVRTCSIAVCLSLLSHSWFPNYRVSLIFFVSDYVLFTPE